MWSLPDIKKMNSSKAQQQKQFERAIKTGKIDGEPLECDSADEHCDGAVYAEPYYDIFSDDISGLVSRCEYHNEREGTPEGYFTCDGCGRLMIENITWENYYAVHNDEMLCIPCYAAEVLADDSAWLSLTDEGIAGVTESTVRKARHLIAVRMPIPEGIEFKNNVEYDSYSGSSISGGGAEELQETLRELKAEGYTRAILILDAAYQFAVSVGVYVPVKGGKYDVLLEVESQQEKK